jgi:hypothetical protein
LVVLKVKPRRWPSLPHQERVLPCKPTPVDAGSIIEVFAISKISPQDVAGLAHPELCRTEA